MKQIMHYLRWRLDVMIYWRRIARYVGNQCRVVEIGTWKGASAVRWLKRNPRALYLVDPYRAKDDESWEGRLTQADMDRVWIEAHVRVNRANHGGTRVMWLRQDSTDAAPHFIDETFCAVYIDGDHSYEAVLADMRAWWPKVADGGVMVLDDCLPGRWWGDDVIRACADFEKESEVAGKQLGRWRLYEKGVSDGS